MTNHQEISRHIASEVREQIQTAIEYGCEFLYYEKEYGTALVVVDIYPKKLDNGMMMTVTDVQVAHEDARHHSPRLAECIRENLPNWDEMESEVTDRTHYQ